MIEIPVVAEETVEVILAAVGPPDCEVKPPPGDAEVYLGDDVLPRLQDNRVTPRLRLGPGVTVTSATPRAAAANTQPLSGVAQLLRAMPGSISPWPPASWACALPASDSRRRRRLGEDGRGRDS